MVVKSQYVDGAGLIADILKHCTLAWDVAFLEHYGFPAQLLFHIPKGRLKTQPNIYMPRQQLSEQSHAPFYGEQMLEQ